MSTETKTPPPEAANANEPARPATKAVGFWGDAWKRFKRNRRSVIGLAFLGFLSFVALFAPFIAGTKPVLCRYKGNLYSPAMGYYNDDWENGVFTQDRFRGAYPANLKNKDPESWAIWPLFYADPFRKAVERDWRGVPGFEKCEAPENRQPPTWQHPMGTDDYGRSVFARMIHGTQISLLVGFVSVGIAAAIGLTLGAIAGYFGGWTDVLLSRLMEVVLSVPSIILILALIAIVEKPSIWKLMSVLGIMGWVSIARLTRGEVMKIKNLDYVTAARALGFGPARIIAKHVLPNSLAPALVSISFGIAGAILTESSLSFLGFGVPPPTPSWGAILRAGFQDYSQWWQIVFPGAGVFVAVFTYNVLGDGWQQAIDPRLR